MKKAISYWSFPGGLEGTADIRSCLQKAKDFGFEGMELGVYYQVNISPISTQENMEKLNGMTEESGF